MAASPVPSPDTLRRLLDYNPETGELRWRARTPDLFEDGAHSAERRCLAWNRRLAGKAAFTAKSHGYLVGRIFNVMYRAHVVAWAIHHGKWPSDQVDHEDGNTGNTRIRNLRDVTNAVNGKNQRRRCDNTSGATGVLWDRGRWVARIKVDGKARHLGRFATKEAAIAARKAAAQEYGFHQNHGAAR